MSLYAGSDVNKDLTCKAKAKDFTFKTNQGLRDKATV